MGLVIKREEMDGFEDMSSREWLVTNGLGGYASGTLSGANTRRYHSLLIAPLNPPSNRMNLLSKVEEAVMVDGQTIEMSSNEYPGAIHPDGWTFLERYENDPVPTFWYRPREGISLRKRVWMTYCEHTTHVQYTLEESELPISLRLVPQLCWKDFHAQMQPWDGFPMRVDASPGIVRVQYTSDSPIVTLTAQDAEWSSASWWNYQVIHARERERGLDFCEDLYCAGWFTIDLDPGQNVTLTATIESDPLDASRSLDALLRRRKKLIADAGAKDELSQQLVLAGDQFVIDATKPNRRLQRSTIMAGYHWFGDWGRDTMIALPGLCLETGRFRVARDILTSFAVHASQGMLPNRFPDRGEEPEYNTVDATLWYFEAVRRYVEMAPDGLDLGRELWPVLAGMIDWHVRGTRYGIAVDPVDGLLRAGIPGVQLTWMDARIGNWVVTPRIGKPVEINALWHNALRTMESLGSLMGKPGCEYADRADLAAVSFQQTFPRTDGLGLYDVLGDEGPDSSIRPNQIFAVSLHHSPLLREQQESVVRTVQERLLTPHGLRTLDPSDPVYRPHYGGGVVERDSAYHQGTVWPWLLGAFVEAHRKVYGRPEVARRFLEPIRAHLSHAGIGSISEVFDAEEPYRPDGCIAQAWSVAEVYRAWRLANSNLPRPRQNQPNG